jgi:hypothetical protein
MPVAAYRPSCLATKKPVWFVFGVQSSANRTVAGVPENVLGDGLTVVPEAGADAVAVVVGELVLGLAQPATTRMAAIASALFR